jgi:hypothetical protein
MASQALVEFRHISLHPAANGSKRPCDRLPKTFLECLLDITQGKRVPQIQPDRIENQLGLSLPARVVIGFLSPYQRRRLRMPTLATTQPFERTGRTHLNSPLPTRCCLCEQLTVRTAVLWRLLKRLPTSCPDPKTLKNSCYASIPLSRTNLTHLLQELTHGLILHASSTTVCGFDYISPKGNTSSGCRLR